MPYWLGVHKAEIRLLPNMPTGPRSRVADNRLAKQLLDWEPKTNFAEGLRRTVDWYYGTKKRRR
jgi:nucleoside-diphosphate-sugar epimerase